LDNNGNAANVLTLETTSGTVPGVTVNNRTATISAVLSGTQGLVKSGTGTLILSGANTYTGTTAITGGTLTVGANGATGNLSSATVTMSGSSILQFNRTDTYTFSNVVSGVGRITQAGSGTLIVTGNNSGLTGHGSVLVSAAVSANRTLQGRAGTDTGYAGATATVDAVFGTGAITTGGNSTLQLRANGSDAGAQRLTFQNTLFVSGSPANFTVDVDRFGTNTGTNKTIAMGPATIVGGSTMNVTGDHGYQLELRAASGSALTVGGSGSLSMTLNPTTASLIISGSVNNSATSSAKTLILDGTATGNAVNGGIGNGLGTFAVTKSNSSTWTLSGNNTYSGGTTITAGTLMLSGAGNLGTGNVTIGSGGTLDITGVSGSSFTLSNTQTLNGDGIVNAAGKTLVVNGTFNPGSSPGDFDVTGDFTLGSTSVSNFEINGVTTGLYDSVQATGALTFGGTLNLTTGYAAVAGQSVDLFDWGTTSGAFTSITGTDLGGGLSWDTSALYTTGVITVVPEPGTCALLALTGTLCVSFRRRRN